MSRYGWLLAPALALLAPLALSGCAKNDKPVAEAEHADHEHAEGEHGHDHEHGHEGHDHSNLTDDQAKIDAELASLPADEQKLVELQDKKCPVSDHLLGSMGKPIKITDVEGREVMVCCAGCEEPLRKEPEKYLAKLKKE
jgi:hypothetical protein